MDYKIITSSTPEGITSKVNDHIKIGWKPLGGHSVVGTYLQNKFSGNDHKATSVELEYSQSMVKEEFLKTT